MERLFLETRIPQHGQVGDPHIEDYSKNAPFLKLFYL